MTLALAAATMLLTFGGIGELPLEQPRGMAFSIGSVGVLGAAPPVELVMDSSGLACATQLHHDLRSDMTLRRFTGIGSKCIDANDEMRRQFRLLAQRVASGQSRVPSRGSHYLKYSLGQDSEDERGILALVPDQESEVINQAIQIFHSLHHQISMDGHVRAGIRPEVRLHDGRIVEFVVHNIGSVDVSISNPRDWKDSQNPTVPRVTISIWEGERSTVAALTADNLSSNEIPEDAVVIPSGESVSLAFRLSPESLEDIRLLPENVQIAGRLRLHVQFESGPAGMATGSVEPTQVRLPQ